MTKPVLRGLFTIKKTHRLEIEPAAKDVQFLPYQRFQFVEMDSEGRPVARIHYWEAFHGELYGGEYLDLANNVLKRVVASRRATAKHRAA